MAWKSKDAERTPSDVPFVVANDPSKVSTAIGWLRLFSVSRSTCKKAYDATQQKGHHVVTTRNSLGIQLHHVKRTAPITH